MRSAKVTNETTVLTTLMSQMSTRAFQGGNTNLLFKQNYTYFQIIKHLNKYLKCNKITKGSIQTALQQCFSTFIS